MSGSLNGENACSITHTHPKLFRLQGRKEKKTKRSTRLIYSAYESLDL